MKYLVKTLKRQLAMSREVTPALLLSSILIDQHQNKRFVSQKLFGGSRLQTLLFGWREPTTGNTSVFEGYYYHIEKIV